MSSEYEQLIEELRGLRRSKLWSRLTVSVFLLCATTIPIGGIVVGTYNLFSQRFGEITDTVVSEAKVVADFRYPTVKEKIESVGNVYIREFQKVVDRDFDDLEKELFVELKRVSDYAGSKWEPMKQQIDKMALEQEQVLIERLHELLNIKLEKGAVERLEARYREAITKRLHQHWQRFFDEHKRAVYNLEHQLIRASNKEPDLMRTISGQEAAGLVLEFAGLELQAETQGGM